MPKLKPNHATTFSLLLFLLIFIFFFHSKPSKTSQNRRILRGHHHKHAPVPFDIAPSLPPSLPPLPSLPKYPSSSFPTPNIPTTSTFPFFPSLPSPPPPFVALPSTSVPTFPGNVSAILPTTPHSPSRSSKNFLPTILLPLLCFSLLCLSLSLLLLHLRRRRRRSSARKDNRSDSIRLFPPPPPSTSNPSTEFLYLGTLVSPHGTVQPPTDPSASNHALGTLDQVGSPELRPLPPLPRLVNCSHGLAERFNGSGPSSVSDPELGLSSVSSSFATSSSPTRYSQSSKETEASNGPRGDIGLRPPPLPPPSSTILRRQNQNSNPNSQSNNSTPRLKPLYWDKVPPSSSREMAWDQLKSNSFQLNEEMIQSLFGANGGGKQMNMRNGISLSGKENGLIDPKKAQNISILLKALNVSKQQVCQALFEGDIGTISNEVLESILKMEPTKEEEQKLKQYKEENSTFKLNPAESFLKLLTEIPVAFKRVDALIFASNFEFEVTRLKGIFGILEAACEELQNSKLFHKLLEAILKIGNRINLGTHFGDAKAFKLDTLLKLPHIKSTNGETTLLNFVLQEVVKCEELGLQFVTSLGNELINVKKAGTIDLKELSDTVFRVSNGIEKIREFVRIYDDLKFSEKMSVFLRRAELEMLEIQERESVVLSSVRETAEYFHGDLEKEGDLFRIFGVVRDFLIVLDGKFCKEIGGKNDFVFKNNEFKSLI